MKDFVMPLSLSNICLCTCQIFAISSLKHLFAQILCPRAQICVLTRVVAILNFFWRNELMLHSRREKEMAKTLFARKARQDIRFTLCKIISTSLLKMPVHFTFNTTKMLFHRDYSETEWEKVWSRLSAHLQPFFWLLARNLTIFDKKYRILTCRDKSECYIVLL